MPSLWKLFTSDIDVCQSCKTNENLDIQKLKTILKKMKVQKDILFKKFLYKLELIQEI